MKKKTKLVALFSTAAVAAAASVALLSAQQSLDKVRSDSGDYTITIMPEDITTSDTSIDGQAVVKTDQLHNDVKINFEKVKLDSGNLVILEDGYLANAYDSQIRSIKTITVYGNDDIFNSSLGWEAEGSTINYVENGYYWASGTDADVSSFIPNYLKLEYRAVEVTISKIVIEFDKECVVGENPTVNKDGLKYRKVNNDHAMLIGFSGSSFADVVVADTVEGLPVTEIADSAFYYNTTIESINFGANVRKVGDYAFTCTTNLTSITGLNALTHVGSHAFYMCYVTGDVAFTSALEEIGNGAFMDTYLTSVTFADVGDPYVDDAAFRSVDELVSIHIGSEMTQFYDDLSYNYKLETITVGAGNTKYSAVDNVLYNDAYHSVVCLAGNRAETSFTLPAGYTLTTYCAYGNKTLEELHMNATDSRIPDYSFNYCENLRTIDFGTNPNLTIEDAFSNCTSLEDLVISSNVKTISQHAFEGCTRLSSVEFEEGCTTLNRGAFKDCTRLSHVLLPTTLTSIGESGGWSSEPTDVFDGCTALTTVLTRLELGNSYSGTIEADWYGARTLLYHSDVADPDAWHEMNDAPTSYATQTIYVQSNATFSGDGAWYALWAWNTKFDGYFFYDHNAPVNYLYCIEIPANYRCVLILRMQSDVNAGDYTNNFPVGKVWNQSPSFLLEAGKDEATITGWGLEISWSTHA